LPDFFAINWATAIKKTVFASEQQRDDVAAARNNRGPGRKAVSCRSWFFLDETSASTDRIRRYGRALGGARGKDAAPAGHWQTLTFIAGLRADPLTAPWRLNQAMNGAAFKEYLRSQLGLMLRPGDIVICDHLPAHKAASVRELIEARGATLKYLPPYSPDLNPIEQVFAKLKALLRQAAQRTYDKLWQAIGQSLDQFQADECLNYCKNSGYAFN
jgi:transposase